MSGGSGTESTKLVVGALVFAFIFGITNGIISAIFDSGGTKKRLVRIEQLLERIAKAVERV